MQAREEAERRVKLEGEAKRQAEAAERARIEEAARRAGDEKARALTMKKEDEDRRKAELAAKREAEAKSRVDAEARSRAEAEAKARAEVEAKREANQAAKLEAEKKAKAEEKARLDLDLARRQANLLTRYDGLWVGVMTCGVGISGTPGFDYLVILNVAQGAASLVRNNDNVYEKIVGKVSGRELVLRGQGYRHNDRSRGWSYLFSGEFSDLIFEATGSMRAPDGSTEYRKCSMQVKKETN